MHANYPTTGSFDNCRYSFAESYQRKRVAEYFLKNKIKIEAGLVQKTGAKGHIMSIYVRDPDQNLKPNFNQSIVE